MNFIELVGRITADPELKHTSSDIAVTRFTLAVDRNYAKKGSEKEVDFINIVAWRNTAEFVCKYFTKGMRMGLVGTVKTGTYTDTNGIKRYTFEVYADRIEFVERKQNSPSADEHTSEAPAGDFENIQIHHE